MLNLKEGQRGIRFSKSASNGELIGRIQVVPDAMGQKLIRIPTGKEPRYERTRAFVASGLKEFFGLNITKETPRHRRSFAVSELAGDFIFTAKEPNDVAGDAEVGREARKRLRELEDSSRRAEKVHGRRARANVGEGD